MCKKLRYLFSVIVLMGLTNNAWALTIKSIDAVATFNNIGVEVDFDEAPPPGTTIKAEIRKQGGCFYREAHPLSRVINDNNRRIWLFAGSIFYLEPGTTYDVRLSSAAFDHDQEFTVTTRQPVNILDGRGRVYYVSPDGNDSNPCSQAQPCTLRYALSSLTPGDTMVLYGGTYYEGELNLPSSGTETDPILIRAAEGQIPILDGINTDFAPAWELSSPGVYRTMLPAGVVPGSIYNVFLDGEDFFRYKDLSDLQSNRWGYGCHISTDSYVYASFPNGGAPTGHQVTFPKFNTAIHIGSNHHIHIKGIRFQHYDGHHCDDCTETEYNAAVDIDGGSDNIIRECSFYHNGIGVMVKGEANFNEVSYSYFNESPRSKWQWSSVKDGSKGTPGYEGGGILMKESLAQLAPSKGNVFHHNRFEDMFDGSKVVAGKIRPGLPDVCDLGDLRRISTTNMDFHDNVISNCLDDGLETDGAGLNNRIYHNVIKDCSMGLSLAPVAIGPTYVFRNEISGYFQGSDHKGACLKFNVGGDLKSQYLYIYHNTCYTDAPGLDGFKFGVLNQRKTSCNDGLYSWDKVFLRNNIYRGTSRALYSSDSCESHVDMDYDNLYTIGTGNIITWAGTNYQTIESFALAKGEETHGIYGDPGFVDAESRDFHLRPDSINVGKGVEIPGINDLDYRGGPGRPRTGPPDIGAYELDRNHLDAVFANWGEPNQVCLGRGDGTFSCSDISPDGDLATGVALGDLNGDLKLDAVFSNSQGATLVCLGNGDGTFICNHDDLIPGASAVSLGDVDGDNKLDAVFAVEGGANALCLGRGDGTFISPCHAVGNAVANMAVALGKVNCDFHVDAVFATDDSPDRSNEVCLGSGDSNFSCREITPPYIGDRSIDNSYGVALGDLNDDGKLDAVFANDGEPNTICLGDGNGNFSCNLIAADENDTTGVALGDVNGDSRLDAVFANWSQPNQVCFGNGDGTFLPCTPIGSEARNTSAVALGFLDDAVPPAPPRDLVEVAVSSPPGAVAPGAGFSVTDTAVNQGSKAFSTSTTTQYYLSLDTAKGSGDTLLGGSRIVPGLSPGSASTGTVTVTVPSTMALGTYYLLACADDKHVVIENDEGNNCMASSATVQVSLPDLTEMSVNNPPATIIPGGTFSVQDTAKNQGIVPTTKTSTTRYYLSTDSTKGTGDKLLTATRSVTALGAGATSTGTVTVTVPSTTALGSYYLLACADDTTLVAEIVETNNCMASASKVQVSLPDLIETSVSNPPASARRGSSFAVTDTVSNQGIAGSGASTTRYYLSLDSIKDTGDKLLTGTRSVPALGAGATSSGTVNVTVPSSMTPGSYYLLACADDTKVVAETNENNNCKGSSTKVQITQ